MESVVEQKKSFENAMIVYFLISFHLFQIKNDYYWYKLVESDFPNFSYLFKLKK